MLSDLCSKLFARYGLFFVEAGQVALNYVVRHRHGVGDLPGPIVGSVAPVLLNNSNLFDPNGLYKLPEHRLSMNSMGIFGSHQY